MRYMMGACNRKGVESMDAAQTGQNEQKCVLVIEDDASVGACLVEAIVQETPWNAFLVTDGSHAVQVLEELKPDLILLDYLLPHINGLGLYDYLHSHKVLSDIPVIMISANLPREEVNRRNIASLSKPFELDDLLAIVTKVLQEQNAE